MEDFTTVLKHFFLHIYPMRHIPHNLFAIFQESTAPSCTEQQTLSLNPEETNKNDQKTRKHYQPGETEQILV